MANAKQCDICGKFYAAHKLSREMRRYDIRDTATVMLFDPDPNAKYPGELEDKLFTMETCPECIKRIREFIDTIKENEND